MAREEQGQNVRRGLEMVVRMEEAVSALLVLLVLGLVLLQITARYVFNDPFVWTGELARFGLVWLTFVGSTFVMARGRHIAVDVVSQPLGPRGRMALDIVSSIITIATALFLLPASFDFTVSMNRIGSPALDIPMSVVYSAGLVGFALLAAHCLVRLIIAVREGPEGYEDDDIMEHIAGGGVS